MFADHWLVACLIKFYLSNVASTFDRPTWVRLDMHLCDQTKNCIDQGSRWVVDKHTVDISPFFGLDLMFIIFSIRSFNCNREHCKNNVLLKVIKCWDLADIRDLNVGYNSNVITANFVILEDICHIKKNCLFITWHFLTYLSFFSDVLVILTWKSLKLLVEQTTHFSLTINNVSVNLFI